MLLVLIIWLRALVSIVILHMMVFILLCISSNDRLILCFVVALESLIDYSKYGGVANDDQISVIALFDHEEIGSRK